MPASIHSKKICLIVVYASKHTQKFIDCVCLLAYTTSMHTQSPSIPSQSGKWTYHTTFHSFPVWKMNLPHTQYWFMWHQISCSITSIWYTIWDSTNWTRKPISSNSVSWHISWPSIEPVPKFPNLYCYVARDCLSKEALVLEGGKLSFEYFKRVELVCRGGSTL